jgi:hypothetical protein
VRATLYLERGPVGTDLRWGRAAGATSYRVYRGTTPGFLAGSPVPWSVVSQENETDPEVPAGILFYVVRATDGSVESSD